MQTIVHVPDDLIEKVKDTLPPPEMGMLKAVALDAILGFLEKLGDRAPGHDGATRRKAE